ncbi:hypothetical protein TNCV_4148441 [Trichonephila clavipes]|nr:hypothetical protein TNCV_4148441 [Trichonephila clavipes]
MQVSNDFLAGWWLWLLFGGCEVACLPRSIFAGVDRFSGCENRWHTYRIIMWQYHLEKFATAVTFSDSRAALLAIASDEKNPIKQGILDYRHHLKNPTALEKT